MLKHTNSSNPEEAEKHFSSPQHAFSRFHLSHCKAILWSQTASQLIQELSQHGFKQEACHEYQQLFNNTSSSYRVLLNSSALAQQFILKSESPYLSLTGWGLSLTGMAQHLLWGLNKHIVLPAQSLGMLDILYPNSSVHKELCKTQEYSCACAEPFLWVHPSPSFLPLCSPGTKPGIQPIETKLLETLIFQIIAPF